MALFAGDIFVSFLEFLIAYSFRNGDDDGGHFILKTTYINQPVNVLCCLRIQLSSCGSLHHPPSMLTPSA